MKKKPKPAKPTKKKPVRPPAKPKGRPGPKPKKINFKRVERLAAQGMTNTQIRQCLGMSNGAFYAMKNGEQDFLDAIESGRAKGIELVTGQLLWHVKNKNLAACIFFLKTQAGWKETTVNELVGKDGAPLQPISEAERIDRLYEILAPALTGGIGLPVGPAGKALVSPAGATTGGA